MAKNVNDKPDEDEREFDVDLEEDDDLENDDEDEDEKEPTLEELKAEVARMQKALRKANKEAARTRIAGKSTKPVAKPNGEDDDADDKSGEAEQWKVRAIRNEMKSALLAAGFTGSPKAAARLTKLIDVDEVEYEDDEVVGLEEQVEDLKEEFPNMFKADEEDETPVRRVRTESRVRGAQDGKTTRKQLTASERQVQALLGGGRR